MMSKTVTRYRLSTSPFANGYLEDCNDGEYVVRADTPNGLVSAKDYDSLKEDYATLEQALFTISSGLVKHGAAAIAYEALKKVGVTK